MKDIVIPSDRMQEASPVATATIEQEPRWPIVYALVASWLFPATTARRTTHVPLWQVWIFHFCCVFLIAVTIVFLITFSETRTISIINVFDRFVELLREIHREFQRPPFDVIAIIFFSFIGIQFLFLALPFFIMPWGARDEPIRSSYRHALRQLWIRTAHILLLIMVIPTMGIFLQKYKTEWLVKHPEEIIIHSSMVAVLWILWALLRSIGASRHTPKIDRPPLCEACGYNLTSIPMTGRCPECGEPVIDSLGPDARSGTPWQRHGEFDRQQAWQTCFLEPIRFSQKFGRKIQVTQTTASHRHYFALHLPVIYLVGTLSLLSFYLVDEGIDSFLIDMSEALFVTSMFGCVCVLGTIVVTLFSGWLIGWAQSLRHKRNLMPASIQASCYLSGYLILWAIFGAANAFLLRVLYEFRVIHTWSELTGMYRENLVVLMWFIPNITCGIYYLLLVARVTSGAWYANR